MVDWKQKNEQNNLGCIKDPRDKRDFKIATIQAPIVLPEVWELEKKYKVKDQNGIGSCVGQAVAGHKEYHEDEELSARFIYSKTKEIDGYNGEGTYARLAMKVLCDNGDCKEDLFPERHDIGHDGYKDISRISTDAISNALIHRSQSYWSIDGIENIKQTLFQQKVAVVMIVPWYSNYNKPNLSGEIEKPNGGEVGGHAIIAVGWKNGYLKCRNSWSNNWGKDGYFYFPNNNPIWGAWFSLDLPQELPVDNRYGQGRTWSSYLREKTIAFNPWLIKKIGRLANNREIKGLAYGFWPYEFVYEAKAGDKWLHMSYPQYLKDLKETNYPEYLINK